MFTQLMAKSKKSKPYRLECNLLSRQLMVFVEHMEKNHHLRTAQDRLGNYLLRKAERTFGSEYIGLRMADVS